MNNLKEGTFVKLSKLSDDKFDGQHPNLILSNHTVYGTLIESPTIGHNVVLTGVSGDSQGWFRTSYVQSIDGNIIKTNNSTYKIEEYGERDI